MLCFCHCVADDIELERLAQLVEQGVNEHPSSVRNATVADVENGHAAPCQPQTESAACNMTSSSIVDNWRCFLNPEPVDNTEAHVTETDEQCQYSCCILILPFSLRFDYILHRYLCVFATRQCLRRHYVFGLFVWAVSSFVGSSSQILLPQCLMNALNTYG